MKPEELSRFCIPLFRLVPMPIVRPTLLCDLVKLEHEFVHGYREGLSVFYVSTTNEAGETMEFTSEEMASWSIFWKNENDRFLDFIGRHAELHFLKNLKFFVCDGNHRRLAWMTHISKLHAYDQAWHISVDSIVLETMGRMELVMQVMHDINKHTEDSHVKTNLVHTLYRVQKYGVLSMEKFAELHPLAASKGCEKSLNKKTWYNMSVELLTSFIFQQEIAAAADHALRKFHEKMAEDEKCEAGILDSMRAGAKEKATKLHSKMIWLVAVANPNNGKGFLAEVERHYSSNEVPKMTLEKLQIVTSCHTSSYHKIKFLKWWNSSMPSRDARRFPPRPVSEDNLKTFLTRCVWYAGVEDVAVKYFNDIIKVDNVNVDMSVPMELETLPEYIEGWRRKIWDQGFMPYFKGGAVLKRTDNFTKFHDFDLAVRRIIFRYIKHELLAKKAIGREDLPPFLSTWYDSNSADCVELVNLVVHEFANLDEAAKSKAIAKRTTADKKKEAKEIVVWEQKAAKEAERLAKAEENRRKGGCTRSMPKRKKGALGSGLRLSPSLVEEGSHVQGNSNRGLKRKALLDQWAELDIMGGMDVVFVADDHKRYTNELLLNFSIMDVVRNMKTPGPNLYTEVMDFLKKFPNKENISYATSKTNQKIGVDLVLFDCPKNLPVPGISETQADVPDWNYDEHHEMLQAAFCFAAEHLQDHGAMIVVHAHSSDPKSAIAGLCITYNMMVKKEWMGINRLHLTSPFDASSTTQKFGVTLLVKNLSKKQTSKFCFKCTPTMEEKGLDIGQNDILVNTTFTDTLAMNDTKPWRGSREKNPCFFQLLIEAASIEGDVILDCTASTGAAIIACRATGRHILALEEDDDIFAALIKPMISTTSATHEMEELTLIAPNPRDPDAVMIRPQKFARMYTTSYEVGEEESE